MAEPDENGWYTFETMPNGVFDVLAKSYDAGLDIFLTQRFANCVQVDGRVFWAAPVPMTPERIDMQHYGYRPTHWRDIPNPPVAGDPAQ